MLQRVLDVADGIGRQQIKQTPSTDTANDRDYALDA